MEAPDDATLVERIRDGDQSAWDALVDRHSGLLWRLARRVVSDDAAASDAMQTAWLQLLQHVDRISDPAAVRGWLCTTVRREAVALSKARSRQPATDPTAWSFDEPAPAHEEPDELVAANATHRTVLDELANLGDRCRQLLTLLAHKIAYDQIAESMEMAVGSIGPTRNRCLDQLRAVPAIQALGVRS